MFEALGSMLGMATEQQRATTLTRAYTRPRMRLRLDDHRIVPPGTRPRSPGMARSFSEPVVHRSLKANLINAIGGRAVVFISLKTYDVAGR